MIVIRLLFSRRWWKTTLLVVLAVAVMVRLGIWQMDRLEQRRAFNARVQEQIDQPPLILSGAAFDEGLTSMEYRQVVVNGEYDFAQEVVLRNQAWENQFGVHLITPLLIAGSNRAVLVNRGWVPYEDYLAKELHKYAEPGMVVVQGVIRFSQTRPDIGWRNDPIPGSGEPRLEAWNMVNVPGIDNQVPYSLLPVYIQQSPEPSWTDMPYRSRPHLELTEGSHLGYAVQWFAFAVILGCGYPYFVKREANSSSSLPETRAK